ncbi:MAG: hypothetical protein KBF88_09940 [Polyangiaceae bacterium]|nr:hypothetical protein [Polyangiaceae bacterium]
MKRIASYRLLPLDSLAVCGTFCTLVLGVASEGCGSSSETKSDGTTPSGPSNSVFLFDGDCTKPAGVPAPHYRKGAGPAPDLFVSSPDGLFGVVFQASVGTDSEFAFVRVDPAGQNVFPIIASWNIASETDTANPGTHLVKSDRYFATEYYFASVDDTQVNPLPEAAPGPIATFGGTLFRATRNVVNGISGEAKVQLINPISNEDSWQDLGSLPATFSATGVVADESNVYVYGLDSDSAGSSFRRFDRKNRQQTSLDLGADIDPKRNGGLSQTTNEVFAGSARNGSWGISVATKGAGSKARFFPSSLAPGEEIATVLVDKASIYYGVGPRIAQAVGRNSGLFPKSIRRMCLDGSNDVEVLGRQEFGINAFVIDATKMYYQTGSILYSLTK